MVAQLAEWFVSIIYILGIVVVGSLVISVTMATIQRIIGSLVDVFIKPDEGDE